LGLGSFPKHENPAMKSIDRQSIQKAYSLFESGEVETDNREVIFKGIEQSYYYEGYDKDGHRS